MNHEIVTPQAKETKLYQLISMCEELLQLEEEGKDVFSLRAKIEERIFECADELVDEANKRKVKMEKKPC